MKKKAMILAMMMGCMLAVSFVAACQPKASETSVADTGSQEAETEAADFAWTTEANCETCHPNSSNSYTDSACAASQHADVACITCHDDTEGLEKAHKKVTMADTDGAEKLKKTKVSSEVCIGCHPLDDTHASATADVTALTDKLGNVVNPHDLPVFEDTGRGTHEKVLCADCHKMHSAETPEDNATTPCKSCHHQGTYVSCYSAGCHESSE